MSIKGIKISGTGSYVPDLVVTNDMFAEFLDTSDEWITTRTGIKTRHINKDKPNFVMGVEAAKKALESSGIKAEEIDLIIVTTVSPDFYYPSMSCLVQHAIGAEKAMTLDVNCACTGFIYGLDMARRYLYTDDVDKVLLVSSENMSNQLDYTDRAACILFGDGAAAAVIERDDKVYSSFLGAKGETGALLSCKVRYAVNSPFKNQDIVDEYFGEQFKDFDPYYVHMNGKEVYKFAIDAMPNAIVKACEKIGIAPTELDFIIPHQANIRIIEKAAQNLGLDLDKIYINLQNYGNTSSASIPICLDELNIAGKLKSGMKVCFVGFGAGLTFGAVIVEL